MNKALVTGASGFVGRHLIRALLERGVRVRALVHEKSCDLVTEVVRADITKKNDALDAAMESCDGVFHCAGAVGDSVTWEVGRSINVEGTRNVVSAARHAGVRRFVHVSTLGVYGVERGAFDEQAPRVRANEPYTDTKIAAEEAVEAVAGDMSYRFVRPGMIYGPGDTGMLPRFAEMMRKRVPLIGKGDTGVALVHVSDVVTALIAAAEHEGEERAFNVVGPDDVSWRELATRVSTALGLPRPRSMPRAIASTIATVCEALVALRLIKRAPLTRCIVKLLTYERRYSSTTLARVGVRPCVAVADGLPAAIAALA